MIFIFGGSADKSCRFSLLSSGCQFGLLKVAGSAYNPAYNTLKILETMITTGELHFLYKGLNPQILKFYWVEPTFIELIP